MLQNNCRNFLKAGSQLSASALASSMISILPSTTRASSATEKNKSASKTDSRTLGTNDIFKC